MREFSNSDSTMRDWWTEYEQFMKKVVKVKKLTKKQVSKLPNIRIKR